MIKIAIDLDNTITYAPSFFSLFTKSIKNTGAKIYIITNREKNSEEEIKDELVKYGIEYDHIKITENKAEYIEKENIDVFFENQDEYFKGLPEEVLIFKIREDRNYNFDNGKWYYNNRTGQIV